MIQKFYAYKNIIKYDSAIRDRIDIIKLILNIFTIPFLHKEEMVLGVCIVFQNDENTNRVFIYENESKQVQSFHVPFILKDDEIRLENSLFPDSISCEDISLLKTFFNSYTEFESCFDNFMEDFLEIFEANDELKYKENNYWNLILYLLSFEPGYFRYDNDIVGFKEDFPKLHPIQHLDLYYNNRGTFKIGLHKEYNTDNLIDLTDRNTDCKFLDEDN